MEYLIVLLITINSINHIICESNNTSLIETSNCAFYDHTSFLFGFKPVRMISKSMNTTALLYVNNPIVLKLYGMNLGNDTKIGLTLVTSPSSNDCSDLSKEIVSSRESGRAKLITVKLDNGLYYMCVKQNNGSWTHQGNHPGHRFYISSYSLPLSVYIFLVGLLSLLSGLFSGLNLGVMSLDLEEVQAFTRGGTEKERRYATIILPVRKKGNWLLCSLLLGNTLVNSTNAILLESITSSSVVAMVGSTLSILIFGEIVPQSICLFHGLAVGAKTILITNTLMILTFPISYPIAKILDYTLGEERGILYDREKIVKWLQGTQQQTQMIGKNTIDIIKGVMRSKTKTVGQIMTKLSDVYMLPIDAVISFQTLLEIEQRGYSRIPIYEGQRTKIVGILLMKDLSFVDSEDKKPISQIIQMYKHPLLTASEKTNINEMLDIFKKGASHLAFVYKANQITEEKTSTTDVNTTRSNISLIYPTQDGIDKLIIGIVTLEDVIEEILQCEIVDEYDTITDNQKKMARKEYQQKLDLQIFTKIADEQMGFKITPETAVAAFIFLSSTIDAFADDVIGEKVLRNLLLQKIYYRVNVDRKDVLSRSSKDDPGTNLYTRGKGANYFILIIDGRVRVTIGRENLVFTCGNFSYFGTEALIYPEEEITKEEISAKSVDKKQSVTYFIPDYNVKIIETTEYLKIKRHVYTAAYKISKMNRAYRTLGTIEAEDENSIRDANEKIKQIIQISMKSADYEEQEKNKPDTTVNK